MAESLRAGLSFGLGGFGYWSHDIAGFESGTTPDLYKRWTQFGLLSSHSRYHGSSEYKVPWLYGEEAVDVSRAFTNMKLKLMPYLQAQSVLTATTGVPMMRPMILDFQEDVSTHTLDRQYMLGESLLVAPIFNEEGTATFYTPNTDGEWIDYLTGQVYAPGKWQTQTYDYFHLPLLVKPGSIIIEGQSNTQTVYDYAENVTVNIFNLQEDHATETNICDEKGEQVATIIAKRVSDKVTVDVQGKVTGKVRLHVVENGTVKQVEGMLEEHSVFEI